NLGGARQAAEHLLGLGHRRLGIIGLGDAPMVALEFSALRAGPYATVRDRAEGYAQALEAAAAEVVAFETDASRGGVTAIMERRLGSGDGPTARLAMSDRVALLAMDWLQQRGRRVPGDVSIVGFDGVPEGAETLPGLTTVAQPM